MYNSETLSRRVSDFCISRNQKKLVLWDDSLHPPPGGGGQQTNMGAFRLPVLLSTIHVWRHAQGKTKRDCRVTKGNQQMLTMSCQVIEVGNS